MPIKGYFSHFLNNSGQHNIMFGKKTSMEFFDCLRYSTGSQFLVNQNKVEELWSYILVEYFKNKNTLHLLIPRTRSIIQFGAHRVINDQIQTAGEISLKKKTSDFSNQDFYEFMKYRLGFEYKDQHNQWKVKGFTENFKTFGISFASKLNKNLEIDLTLEADIDGQNHAYGMNFNYSN